MKRLSFLRKIGQELSKRIEKIIKSTRVGQTGFRAKKDQWAQGTSTNRQRGLRLQCWRAPVKGLQVLSAGEGGGRAREEISWSKVEVLRRIWCDWTRRRRSKRASESRYFVESNMVNFGSPWFKLAKNDGFSAFSTLRVLLELEGLLSRAGRASSRRVTCKHISGSREGSRSESVRIQSIVCLDSTDLFLWSLGVIPDEDRVLFVILREK